MAQRPPAKKPASPSDLAIRDRILAAERSVREQQATQQDARTDAVETTNTNQQGQLSSLSSRISTEAATNDAQATAIASHSNRLNDFGPRITSTENVNQNQSETIQNLSRRLSSVEATNRNLIDRIKALEAFKNRPSGFASSATNNGGANHVH